MAEENVLDSEEQPTAEELIESSPEVTPKRQKQEPKPKESKKAEEPEKVEKPEPQQQETEPEKAEEKAEEPVSEKAESEETKEEPKESEEEETETAELTEEQSRWKKDSEDKKKWQGELTRKSQLVNAMKDEEVVEVQTHKKLMDKVKDIEIPPVSSQFEVLVGEDDLGEPEYKKLSVNKIKGLKEFIEDRDEKVRQSVINEFAKEMAVVEKERKELQTQSYREEEQRARFYADHYFEEFPDSKFDFGEDMKQTFSDILSVGPMHPDHDRLLNFMAISDRSAKKGITLEDAHKELFGKKEQKLKAKKKLKEEQEGIQQEGPGKTTPPKTEDKEFEESLGIGVKPKVDLFE